MVRCTTQRYTNYLLNSDFRLIRWHVLFLYIPLMTDVKNLDTYFYFYAYTAIRGIYLNPETDAVSVWTNITMKNSGSKSSLCQIMSGRDEEFCFETKFWTEPCWFSKSWLFKMKQITFECTVAICMEIYLWTLQ